MLKTLLAAAAIAVCCVGNNFPAKAQFKGCEGFVSDCFVNGIDQDIREQEMRQRIEREVQRQLQMNTYGGF